MVKQIAAQLTGLPKEYTETQESKDTFLIEWGMTMREMQQRIGTNAMRKGLHENVWVISSFAGYSDNDNWAFSDVRFPNEADAILEKGGTLIRIERPGIKSMDHPSETSLDNYPFENTLYNDCTLEEYHILIRKFILTKIFNKW
jgi:hypothetical protein